MSATSSSVAAAEAARRFTLWHINPDALPRTPGEYLADRIAAIMGSWRFIIVQSALLALWIVLNILAWFQHWDPYPFILLNLVLSFQAAFTAPILMMAQNRQSQRDRVQAQEDFDTNVAAKKEIEALQLHLSKIETDKLDKILQILEKMKT